MLHIVLLEPEIPITQVISLEPVLTGTRLI